MARFGVVALLGAYFFALVSAQATQGTLSVYTSYTPTQTWTPAATCSAGSSYTGSGLGGGVYEDPMGTYWEFDCGMTYSGTNYYDVVGSTPTYVGTNGNGVISCFWGCSNRIGCQSFIYTGTVTNNVSGSGRC